MLYLILSFPESLGQVNTSRRASFEELKRCHHQFRGLKRWGVVSAMLGFFAERVIHGSLDSAQRIAFIRLTCLMSWGNCVGIDVSLPQFLMKCYDYPLLVYFIGL